MPHVIVKLWPGKTEAQKQDVSDAIVRAVTGTLNYGPDAVSVGFDEIPAQDWDTCVFELDILGKWNSLAKQPGYGRRPGRQGEIAVRATVMNKAFDVLIARHPRCWSGPS